MIGKFLRELYGIEINSTCHMNRVPTINFGSIQAVKCVRINDNYTMGMPLQVLETYAADFDGDCLNIMYVPNIAFWKEAIKVFSPRYSLMISKNDGRFNNSVNIFKDILININGLVHLSRKYYTKERLSKIEAVKKKWGNA